MNRRSGKAKKRPAARSRAAEDGALEAARRSGARLVNALDGLLPIARVHMTVAPEHGGPAPDAFIPDPDDAQTRVLPQVLEAEQALHACRAAFPPPARGGTSGLEKLPESAFIDESRGAAAQTGDEAVDAAMELVEAFQAGRARRIAGLPDDEAELDAIRVRLLAALAR